MNMPKTIYLFIFLLPFHFVNAQDINLLVKNAKDKLNQVNDYEAHGRMRTNVAFLKVPVASVLVYFKKPNKLKVKSEKGISFIPKGAVSINMGSMLSGEEFTIIDGGSDKIGNIIVRVAKLLPINENSDVVLSTIYIDPVNKLIQKAKTTTRDNGSYELEMAYGNYAAFGLPDKIVFSFNTKDYKLPKGMTFDFDDGNKTKQKNLGQNRKGKAEIIFSSYKINKGIPEAIFK